MIQAPFNSSFVALQYKTGTKFFHRAVPELHGIKKLENSKSFIECLTLCPVNTKEGSAQYEAPFS